MNKQAKDMGFWGTAKFIKDFQQSMIGMKMAAHEQQPRSQPKKKAKKSAANTPVDITVHSTTAHMFMCMV